MSIVPSNQTIYGNLSVAGSITSFTNQVATDSFGELLVVERSSVIDLKSVFGVSILRDTVTTTGTGSVTNNVGNPEFALSTTAANDTAVLQSAGRGRYVAGYAAQCGIACRIPAVFTGNQAVRWGYTEMTNGFYFLYNSSGINVAIVRAGVETVIPQASFNVDPLNGTGPSGKTLDVTRGNIYRIDFSWYGYGAVIFNVVLTDSSGNQMVQTVHRWAPNQQTSTMTPNLPIYVGLQNGGTASAANVYIAGRQFSLYGSYSPIYRISSVYMSSAVSLSTGTFLPFYSVRRKSGTAGMGLKIASYDVTSTVSIFLQLRVNATLTDATFANSLQDSPATESMLQYDTAATALSGGTVIYTELITASSGNAISTTTSEPIQYNVPEYQPVTICAKPVGNGGNATIISVLRFKEEF